MLADLKRFCGINKGGIVVSPVGRVVDPATAGAGTALHVVTGTQAQNMQRMGRRGRGGGQTTDPDAGRVAGGAGAPVPAAAQRMGR